MATRNNGNFEVTVNASKYMTFPSTPGFFAYNDATLADQTGDGTLYTPCRMNTEILDRGGNFSANTFIAPTSGVFLLSAFLLTEQNSIASTDGICSIKTTTKTFSTYCNPANWMDSDATLSFKCAAICYMNAGDTAIVELTISGSTKTVDLFGGFGGPYSSFSGILLC